MQCGEGKKTIGNRKRSCRDKAGENSRVLIWIW